MFLYEAITTAEGEKISFLLGFPVATFRTAVVNAEAVADIYLAPSFIQMHTISLPSTSVSVLMNCNLYSKESHMLT